MHLDDQLLIVYLSENCYTMKCYTLFLFHIIRNQSEQEMLWESYALSIYAFTLTSRSRH